MNIETLQEILPPPDSAPAETDVDWDNVQSEYGISVPDDYRELIKVYGAGCIDGFVWLLNPNSKNENLNFDKSKYFVFSYGVMKNDFPDDYIRPLFPEMLSFFPWAVTDNGETFVWIVDGDPNDWKVAIMSSDQGVEEFYEMGASAFLNSLLRKNINSKILPAQFPSDRVDFETA